MPGPVLLTKMEYDNLGYWTSNIINQIVISFTNMTKEELEELHKVVRKQKSAIQKRNGLRGSKLTERPRYNAEAFLGPTLDYLHELENDVEVIPYTVYRIKLNCIVELLKRLYTTIY